MCEMEKKSYGHYCVDSGVLSVGYRRVHFMETRRYLQQVKERRQRIELLENRRWYREDAGKDSDAITTELNTAKEDLAGLIVEVTDEISKIGNARQEFVMTRRYVDGMNWEEIANLMGIRIRAVQSLHGKALPKMQEILLADGKIELVDDHSDSDDHSGSDVHNNLDDQTSSETGNSEN